MCEIRLVIKSGQSPRFFSSYQMDVRILERFSRATSVLRSGLLMNGCMKAHSWKVIYGYVISVSGFRESLVRYVLLVHRTCSRWGQGPAEAQPRMEFQGESREWPWGWGISLHSPGKKNLKVPLTNVHRSHVFFVCLFLLYTNDWS